MSIFGRRLPKAFQVVGRDPTDYAQEFQEFVNQAILVGEGQPAGFLDLVPSTIKAGVAGDPGLASDGWEPPSAVHPVSTAPSIGLSNANSEGTGASLLRADAGIKRDVRIRLNGADLATRNALNFIASSGVSDDVGNDEVDVDLSALAGPFTKGGVFVGPTGVADAVIWRAPFACTVTAVKGYRSGGTSASVNARRNGASEHLAADLVTSAGAWVDGGAVQNTAYVVGDSLEIRLKALVGLPSEIAVQVEFSRP